MQSHLGHFKHVAASQAVPGVHHTVVPECHVDASRQQFRHAGHAAAFGVGVVAPLQRDIDQRVGDHMQLCLCHQGNEFADVIVVHAVHRGQVRACHSALQPESLRLKRQCFNVARKGVIRFIAVHVHHQAPRGCQFAKQFDAQRAVVLGALEVGDSAHHVHAQIQCAREVGHVLLCALHATQDTVLRKGNELQVEVGGHFSFHFEQCPHCQQARVAHVHVAANGEQAFGNRPVAIRESAFHQGFFGEQGFEFAPQGNAFQQSAALVDARQSVAQRGVHMKVRVHKRRRQQLVLRVQKVCRRCVQRGRDFDNLSVQNGNRHAGAAIGQGSVVDQKIQHGEGLWVYGKRGSLRVRVCIAGASCL